MTPNRLWAPFDTAPAECGSREPQRVRRGGRLGRSRVFIRGETGLRVADPRSCPGQIDGQCQEALTVWILPSSDRAFRTLMLSPTHHNSVAAPTGGLP